MLDLKTIDLIKLEIKLGMIYYLYNIYCRLKQYININYLDNYTNRYSLLHLYKNTLSRMQYCNNYFENNNQIHMTNNYPNHYQSNQHMIESIFDKFYQNLDSKMLNTVLNTVTLSLLKLIIEPMKEYIKLNIVIKVL